MAPSAFPPALLPLRGSPRGSLGSAVRVALGTLGSALRRGDGRDLGAQRRTVRLGTVPLSHLVAGHPAGTPLLLVHGTPGSAAGWAPFLREPPPGFRVIAPDRPGFGASGPARAQLGLAAQARAVQSLLPGRGQPRAVLLGHSMGGAVAARVAAEFGDRVGALVLVAASLDPALERIHALQHLGAWAPVRMLLPRAIRNANAELLALQAELLALAPWLARIRCPVFIVHGTADDLVPVANVAYMQRELVGAAQVHVELLSGRNHFLPEHSGVELRRVIAAAGRCAC